MMIRNYVFDLGMVLFRYDTAYMTRLYVADEQDRKLLEDVVFDRKYWDLLDRGEISDETLKAKVRTRLPGRLHAAADRIYDHWIENLIPIEGMEALIRKIKQTGAGVYLLSNISEGFAKTYKTVPQINEVLSLFDGFVFSGTVHLAKPDFAIFRYLLDHYSLEPKTTLFIDDNEKNNLAAKKIGLQTYLFNGDVRSLSSYIKLG